jgi:hypothetical protein
LGGGDHIVFEEGIVVSAVNTFVFLLKSYIFEANLYIKNNIMKTWKKVLIGFIVVTSFFSIVSIYLEKDEKPDVDTNESISSEPDAPMSKWGDREEIDIMDDSKTYHAFLESNGSVNDKHAWLHLVAKDNSKTVVYIMTTVGRLVPGDSMRVRFDKKPPESYSYIQNDDVKAMFILENSAKFLKGLRTAEHTLIECKIVKKGSRIFEFDTAGLVWEY